MTPSGKLALQPWMTAPETRAVTAALIADGAEVRFVGGCVRDAVAGRPVKDIDLATPDPPERVIDLLENARLRVVPTGIDHGTVTAVSDGKAFEVTTLREDVETYGRHARVAFTDDWEADAARRDFTINAMSCGLDGTLFDPFGGEADLAAGRVRFVGDPSERIHEDYLRLLRFFRFHAYFGRGDPDPDGLAAAGALAPNLARLSGERVRAELFRLLEAPDPVPVIEIMLGHGVLSEVLPEASAPGALAELLRIDRKDSAPDPLLRLAALIETDRAGAQSVADRLRLSRAQGERLADLAVTVEDAVVGAARLRLRLALYHLGRIRVSDLLLLNWARRRAAGEAVPAVQLAAALAEVAAWTDKIFPLQGRDVQDLGVSPGPKIGRLLGQVERWWQDEDFGPDREACLAQLRALLQGRP